LWVHLDRFARRNPEEPGVELVDPVKEAAPSTIRLSRPIVVGMVDKVRVPAVRRHLRDRVDTLGQKIPKSAWSISTTRESTANTDDCDGLSCLVCIIVLAIGAYHVLHVANSPSTIRVTDPTDG
jgi:hypothetical protein